MKWILWIILFFFSFWLMFHTFSYDTNESAMLIGRKVWSDFGQHIPVIRSFSLGDNLTRMAGGTMPEFALYPGEPIRYHFLFYSFVGFLEKIGFRIDWALNLPSALGFFLLLIMIFQLSFHLFSNIWISVLSVLFFLFNGTLSFVRFFQQKPFSMHTLRDIATNIDFPSFAPWGPGDISAFWNLNIYTNQRHLGLSFGIALTLIYLFLRIEKQHIKKQLIWVVPVILTLGIFPYFHQPTLLIFGIFILMYFFIFGKLRIFLIITGVLSLIFILPQLALLTHAPKHFAWYPGYLLHGDLSPLRFIQYWWQNLGLHAILIPVGFFFISRRAKRALLPIFFIFIVATLFKFSVEVAASHKLFNFVMILGNMISAWVIYTIAIWKPKLKHAALKFLFSIGRIGVLAGLVGLLTLSGIIDFFAVYNDPKGAISDIPANETATWILDNTPPDAVFLNSSYFYHPASIAGRKIFLGWPYFAWSEGYEGNRMEEMKMMYESTDYKIRCPLLENYHIKYITVENIQDDPDLPSISLANFIENFMPIYLDSQRSYAIFDYQAFCQSPQ